MQQRIPRSSSHSPHRDSGPPGARRRRPSRLIIIAQVLAIMLVSAIGLRAQLVNNGSFEDTTSALGPPNIPGWWYTGPPMALPGFTGSWFTLAGSVDIFWPPLYVPYNFMTSSTSPRTPFHGKNYGGLSTGTFTGVGFSSEVMAGSLSAPITSGTYNVRARFAMGSARHNPCRMEVALVSSTTTAPPLVVGSLLVNNINWNLFSQNVTIPVLGLGQSYDRIRIQGIPDPIPTNNWGAYCFIDSVDMSVVSQNPCDYLSARAEFVHASPTGTGCCWKLIIDNTTPTWLVPPSFVRLTSAAPTTLSGPVTNGPGMTSTTTLPYTAIWKPAVGGPMPTGTGIEVGTYCLNPGPPPQLQVIEFLGPNMQVLCRDSIWTDCKQDWHSCMDLAVGQVLCGPYTTAGQTYNFTLNMNLFLPYQGYVTFSSPQGTLSPNFRWVGAYSQSIPMTFTDNGPVDNHICIYVAHHWLANHKDSIVCVDSICFDLPKCADNCCKDFKKAITGVKIKVSNGTVTLTGCALAGPNQIKRFSATIVAAQTRTKCGLSAPGPWTRIFGDIVSGSLSTVPTLGPAQFVPTMVYSREIVWGGAAFPYCVPFMPCAPFALKMIFPNPPAGLLCRDSLRFSIRYSFTDCKCVTCDTVITYQVPRKYGSIIWDGPVVIGGDPGEAETGITYVQPNPGLLNVVMTSSTTGMLNVTLPQAEPDEPQIRIVGMTVRPEAVPLVSLVESGTRNSATIEGNAGDISYTLDHGQSKVFDLTYGNEDGDRQIRNIVVFRYIVLGDSTIPGDTTGTGDTTTIDTTATGTVGGGTIGEGGGSIPAIEILTSDPVVVYGTTPDGGGDVVETTQSPLQDVRTYALHLVASNAAEMDVRELRLRVNGGATLIAVGPVGDGENVALKSGLDNGGNSVVQVDKDTWTVQNVPAGGTIDPIYLTFAGVGNNTVSVDYATLSENGSPLSIGSAEISSPLRVAGVDERSAEMGVEMMPIYPNPTAHTATVQFDLHTTGSVSVSVRDVRGTEVRRLIDGQQMGAGVHLVPVDTQMLPAGTYVVVMEVGGRMFTRPMTIVR